MWTVKRETTATPPPPQSPKPALSEEELSKKSTAIIEEYLHINDMKVPVCMHLEKKGVIKYVFLVMCMIYKIKSSSISCKLNASLSSNNELSLPALGKRSVVTVISYNKLYVLLFPNRRLCSVCRSWTALSCSLCSYELDWSRHWSAAPLPGSTWASCCISSSRPAPCQHPSIIKGQYKAPYKLV